MTLTEIRSEVESLNDKEKGILIDELLESIEPSAHWPTDDEVLERARQLEEGEVEGISFEELKRRLGK